jgi:hypothetical protein
MNEPPDIVRSADDRTVSGAGVSRTARSESKRQSRSRGDSSPHTARFRSVTAILVGLAVGALVIAGAVASGGRHGTAGSARWSAFAPQDPGTLGARDIADYVAPFYRISSVDQLAVVTVVNLESAAAAAAQQQAAASGTPSSTVTSSGLQVAVRPNPTTSQVGLLPGNTIAYNLCGIGGKDCAIGVGQPSTDRLLLLRREALELALYTFKYVHGTENVVAILPPGHTGTTTTTTTTTPASPTPTPTSRLSKKPPAATAKAKAKAAAATTAAAAAAAAAKASASSTAPVDIAVLLQRQQVQPLLDHPLADTLPEQVPPTVAEIAAAPEAGLIDQVTARGLFSEQLQTAQDGSSLIVLSPLPPQ